MSSASHSSSTVGNTCTPAASKFAARMTGGNRMNIRRHFPVALLAAGLLVAGLSTPALADRDCVYVMPANPSYSTYYSGDYFYSPAPAVQVRTYSVNSDRYVYPDRRYYKHYHRYHRGDRGGLVGAALRAIF